MQETLTLDVPDGAMGIEVVRPDGDGPFPVIVFFHHGPGLDDGSKQAMQLLADAGGGHYVVSHDRYHREGAWYLLTPAMRSDPDAMKRFWGVLTGTTEEMVDRDLTAVLDHLAGGAVEVDGRWLVTRQTYCDVSTQGATEIPPPCQSRGVTAAADG